MQRLRQALAERGYLMEANEPVFDEKMEAAVKALQRDYGLEETGVVDRPTLLAVFYDQTAVDQMLAKYPIERSRTMDCADKTKKKG